MHVTPFYYERVIQCMTIKEVILIQSPRFEALTIEVPQMPSGSGVGGSVFVLTSVFSHIQSEEGIFIKVLLSLLFLLTTHLGRGICGIW